MYRCIECETSLQDVGRYRTRRSSFRGGTRVHHREATAYSGGVVVGAIEEVHSFLVLQVDSDATGRRVGDRGRISEVVTYSLAIV